MAKREKRGSFKAGKNQQQLRNALSLGAGCRFFFFFDHLSFIRNNSQTAVTNMRLYLLFCHRCLCVVIYVSSLAEK